MQTPLKRRGVISNLKVLGLDLHKHASGYDEAIERLNGPGGGFENIDNPFVRPHFELLSALFINVRATQYRIPLDPRRNRNGAAYAGISPLGIIDDFLRRRIQRPMIVCFHPDSNSRLLCHLLRFKN